MKAALRPPGPLGAYPGEAVDPDLDGPAALGQRPGAPAASPVRVPDAPAARRPGVLVVGGGRVERHRFGAVDLDHDGEVAERPAGPGVGRSGEDQRSAREAGRTGGIGSFPRGRPLSTVHRENPKSSLAASSESTSMPVAGVAAAERNTCETPPVKSEVDFGDRQRLPTSESMAWPLMPMRKDKPRSAPLPTGRPPEYPVKTLRRAQQGNHPSSAARSQPEGCPTPAARGLHPEEQGTPRRIAPLPGRR